MPFLSAAVALGVLKKAGAAIKKIPVVKVLAYSVIILMVTTIGVQRCTIKEHRKEAKAAAEKLAEVTGAYTSCVDATKALEERNGALAESVYRQNEALRLLAEQTEARQRASATSMAVAEKQIAEKAKALDILANALRSVSSRPPSACPAGDAVRVVREALK